jgi:hypothetical protein
VSVIRKTLAAAFISASLLIVASTPLAASGTHDVESAVKSDPVIWCDSEVRSDPVFWSDPILWMGLGTLG